jgi:transposase
MDWDGGIRSYVCDVGKSGIGERCTAKGNFASNKTDKQPMPMQNNKLDFSNQNIYVGFDVHLKSWKVSILVENLHHKTFSQDPCPATLDRYLRKNFPGGNYHSAYEAGFCGFWIHEALNAKGIKSCVINPADIPTTGKEKIQKEDMRDSLKIAKSLKAGLLRAIYVPDSENLKDRLMVRMRSTLTKDIIRVKQRAKSFLYFNGIEIPAEYQKSSTTWTTAYVKWLENLDLPESAALTLRVLINQGKYLKGEKLELSRKIRELSKSSKYSQLYLLLRTIPGIGEINAMKILVELDTISRFKNLDHLASFIGLVPSTRSSGEKEKTGDITPRGNKNLRSAITESAWVAVRRDPALMQRFLELSSRMEKNEAIVRIAKKLLSRIQFVLKNKQEYVCGIVK